MTDQTLHINLDFGALCSSYFIQLQHLLDQINVLEAGLSVVSEDTLAESQRFMICHPADNKRLPFQTAKDSAQDWISRAFLRDAIEITGLFLDRCLSAASILVLASKEKAQGDEINRLFNEEPLKNHKLHFPQKLEKLEHKFGVRTPFNDHILSLNKARTCVVHRLGTVCPPDVGEKGELVVLWHSTEIVARELVSGKTQLIDRPGTYIENESVVELTFTDQKKKFLLGEQITFSSMELYHSIMTFWTFGRSLGEQLEAFAHSQGIAVTQKSPSHTDDAAPNQNLGIKPGPKLGIELDCYTETQAGVPNLRST